VRKEAGGVWYVASELLDRLSDSPLFEWLARRELDGLSPELAAQARLLALLAPEFATEEVAGVLQAMERDLADTFPLDAHIGLERLCQAGLLELRRPGRYAFETEIMRDTVAKMVGAPLATRIHRAALAYYRAADMPGPLRLPRLAWHAAAAGERGEASTTYLALAESARLGHVYLEADVLYTRALAQLDAGDSRRRMQALKGRGITRYRLVRHDDALADLAQARALAEEGSDRLTQADVMLEESTALDFVLEWRRSRELAERVRALVPPPAPAALEARILMALGRSLHRFNQDQEAAVQLRAAARLGREAGDEGYEVQVAANSLLGFLLPFIGILDEAEERLQVAAALCEEKGDEMHLAGILGNRACLWIARNDRERFLEDSARVLAYCRRMGNALIERNINFNNAYFMYWRGEHDAALPFAHRMAAIDRTLIQGGFRPDAWVLLARILWARGDRDQSLALVERVERHQDEARAAAKSELLLLPNDVVLLGVTQLLLRGGDGAQWQALIGRAREVAQGQELIEVLELAGLAAAGRDDAGEARRCWLEALEVGRRIPSLMAGRIAQRLAALER
jgi:eukaryotic-like serine/threonine-protein kinase